MQVFLVEDSAPVRARLAEMLAAIPGVSLAGSAECVDGAVRQILEKRPNVVLLDLGLASGGSGFDVLRGVCRDAPEVDFYMLSNFAADPYRQLAERLGARDFFDKSRDLERVREMLAERAAAVH
jgi:DNA-binding NarL/FixJ family response regulator